MKNLMLTFDFYKQSSDDDNDYDEEISRGKKLRYQSVINSLPHVFHSALSDQIHLFADIKNLLDFDESIMVIKESEESAERELSQLTNHKFMSFLLVNKLVLDMFSSTSSFEFKLKLVNDLRRVNYIDLLMHCLFRIMPNGGRGPVVFFQAVDLASIDYLGMDEIDAEHVKNPMISSTAFTNESVEWFSCKLYKHALKCVPAIIRDWWNIQTRRIADQVDKFTTK